MEMLQDWDIEKLNEWGLDLPKIKMNDLTGIDIKEKFEVIIECENEEEQEKFYSQLKDEGKKVRLLSI